MVSGICRHRGKNMKNQVLLVAGVLLALPVWCAGQTPTPKSVSKKSAVPSSKSKGATPAAKPADQAPAKSPYADLTIGELIAEDANRWDDKMSSHASVSGFVTQIVKAPDGDTEVHICENPKIAGMDRARCVVAKCIPKIPCDLPAVGRPITVKGITRYDAGVGAHWWEIHPVEEVEK
jgi:hypothetical protein